MLLTRSTYHRLVSTLLSALLVVLGAMAPNAASAATLVVNGAGDGHGVGMSQDGALGYAEHGWSYTQILGHYYTGTAIGQAPSNATVKVLVKGKVKQLGLEAYVRGVVSAEMPASWPMAALEAQAVASRTYALTAHAGGTSFDVYSDTRSQMYLGKAAETSSTNAAVAATAGQVVTYAGAPAITYFFAGSGGHTENVQDSFLGSTPQPWLVGVPDPYDAGPLHRWRVMMSFATATTRLHGLLDGSFEGIDVLSRGSSPRIVSAEVVGSKGDTPVSGPQLAERLGLYSTWAYFGVSGASSAPVSGADGSSPVSGAGGSSPTPVAQPARVDGSGGVSAR